MITGEAMRTRRRAVAIVPPIRAERASPCPGVNQARAWPSPSGTAAGSTKPLCSTAPVSQSCSKACTKRAASSRDDATTITFSCLVQESSVQFVEPVQTVSPSRTTNLWCMRSGTPAIARAGTPSDPMRAASGSGGGGTGIGLGWSTL